MQEKDRDRFVYLMKRLKVIFSGNMSAKDEALRAEVYWEEFLGTSIENFERAVSIAIGDCTFFPKPTELHEFIRLYTETKYIGGSAIDSDHQLQWMDPTEQGREQAKQLFKDLYARWEQEEAEMEKLRNQRFEERRKELKK